MGLQEKRENRVAATTVKEANERERAFARIA